MYDLGKGTSITTVLAGVRSLRTRILVGLHFVAVYVHFTQSVRTFEPIIPAAKQE